MPRPGWGAPLAFVQAEKRASAYQAALDKANKASEALRVTAAAADTWEETDEADDELQASLARARRVATKKVAGSGGKTESVVELIKQVRPPASTRHLPLRIQRIRVASTRTPHQTTRRIRRALNNLYYWGRVLQGFTT